ncbi:jg15282 [Pararge aegeria aegeria]|uniref:Jg15282 protein n=1 Tax=Pararge aegeria aegeria TaxID=348720 RepID=A0A8S4R430_9NEOP|nr:jg15282 [Pararge aegeria aegeria]
MLDLQPDWVATYRVSTLAHNSPLLEKSLSQWKGLSITIRSWWAKLMEVDAQRTRQPVFRYMPLVASYDTHSIFSKMNQLCKWEPLHKASSMRTMSCKREPLEEIRFSDQMKTHNSYLLSERIRSVFRSNINNAT